MQLLQCHALRRLCCYGGQYQVWPGHHDRVPQGHRLQLAGLPGRLALSAEDTISRIFAIWFPIIALVTIGFEHSVANMFFIPIPWASSLPMIPTAIATLETAKASMVNLIGTTGWYNFFVTNLVPMTLDNIVGAALFVAAIYWYVYIKSPLCTPKVLRDQDSTGQEAVKAKDNSLEGRLHFFIFINGDPSGGADLR
jgi:hypothetical protein